MVSKIFHEGEIEVQRLAGVRDDAEAVGRGVGGAILSGAQRFLSRQRIAVVSSADSDQRVWASLLTGPIGFARGIDSRLLWIAAEPLPKDPLIVNLKTSAPAGVLVIDPGTRQRMRFNGRGVLVEGGLFVTVAQAYGNCPKYIQLRREEPDGPDAAQGQTVIARTLSPRQSAWIERSDTFFIASLHPTAGADASHRGGLPGFVRVEASHRLSFPDYPGNAMFNTLGNLLVNPKAGLLFANFMNGDVLQLTGRARFDPSDRRVTFEIDEARETARAFSIRLRFVEYSRSNPAVDSSQSRWTRHPIRKSLEDPARTKEAE
jgi:predicted pyridoxine 5'-phosphate oxidase superfamily flavin-nucleotide-binding protein